MYVIRGYKKVGTEISFTPLLSFTLAKILFTGLRNTGLEDFLISVSIFMGCKKAHLYRKGSRHSTGGLRRFGEQLSQNTPPWIRNCMSYAIRSR